MGYLSNAVYEEKALYDVLINTSFVVVCFAWMGSILAIWSHFMIRAAHQVG